MNELTKWLTPQEVRNYLKIDNYQLRILREKYGLPFVVFSPGVEEATRRYNKADVDSWVRDNPLVIPHFHGTIYDMGYVHQKDLAAMLKVNVGRVIEWRKRGMPAYEIGSRVYFKPEEVTEWLKSYGSADPS